jgi:hypothetical protein
MSSTPAITEIIQAIAADLVVDECFIEKDWYAMRVIGALSQIQDPEFQLVFCGGTSLSKGFGLIERFSEDLDFKVKIINNYPISKNQQQKQRKAFRDKILDNLEQHQINWRVTLNALQKGNESKFFKVPIEYDPLFQISNSLRPYVQLEVTFESPVLEPELKNLQSFVGKALKKEPEAINFPCVNPIETAADKLSALVWRIQNRNRDSENDDATLVRHLHDLGALANLIQKSNNFPKLVVDCLNNDKHRGEKETMITEPLEAIDFLLQTFKKDDEYLQEYEQFVEGMSYSEDSRRLSFSDALEVLINLKLLFES